MENTKATKWLEKGDDWFDWYECPDCGFKARLRAVTGVELPELPKTVLTASPKAEESSSAMLFETKRKTGHLLLSR